MTNPFDRTFFHFLFGFTAILAVSFAVIFLTSKYSDLISQTGVTASSKTLQK